MEDDALGKLKSSFTKGVAAINIKTSVFLESAKFKTHIRTLQSEIAVLKQEIGDSVYESWLLNNFDVTSIEAKLQLIFQKNEAIDGLRQQIQKLESQEKEVFGNKENKPAEVIVPPAFICSQCGTTYAFEVRFCKKCGNQMVL
jgi:hypothetical protein